MAGLQDHACKPAAGKPGDKGKIVNITIVPDPPKKGSYMDVTATFSFGKLACIISTGIKWHCISPEGDYRGIAQDVTKPQIAVYLYTSVYFCILWHL